MTMSHSNDVLPTSPVQASPQFDAPSRVKRLHLRIWHKLAVIVIAFLVPLALACTYLVAQQRESADLAHNELRGTQYLRSLSTLTSDLVAYRSLATITNRGGDVSPSQLQAAQGLVDRDFARLSSTAPSLQRQLKADLEAKNLVRILPAALHADWRRVKGLAPAEALSSGLTQQLVANVLAQYSYVGETSELILDPDFDSYYTMTALLMNEPVLVNQVGRLGDLLNIIVLKGSSLAPTDRTALIQAAGLADEQLVKLQDSLNRAISSTSSNNTSLRSSVLPLLNQTNGAVRALIGAANFEVSSSEPGLSLADTQPLPGAALQVNTQLWNTLFDQYDRMVHSRIDRMEERNAMLLASIGIAFVLILALTTLTSRRIVHNLSRVANASQALAAGNLERRAHVASHDEVATLADTFNTMADHLQASYFALQESHRAVEDKVRARTEELHKRTKLLHLLQGVATAANKAMTWDEALQNGLTLICTYLDWPAGHAYIVTPSPDDENTPLLFACPAWYTQTSTPASWWKQVQAEAARAPSPLVQSALSSGQPQGPVPLQAETGLPALPPAQSRVRGTVAFPVSARQEIVAVVEFFTSDTEPLEKSTTALIADLVGQLGRVREREITSTALQTAAETAETATRAKSAFLATMSHEIRTPMNAVMGMTELLLDASLTDEQRSFAEIIHNSADSLLTIINDILDFSKFEAGKFQLEQTPVDLSRCIESAFDLITPKAREKAGLDLAYVIGPDLPDEIMSDGMRLRQILVNLLSNAVKFTETGEVVLTVSRLPPAHDAPQSAAPEGQEAFTVQFSVRDTGMGIPPDGISQLFLPFEQLDSSTTRRYGGTGLGLAISQRLVEQMGGMIWCESEVGQGSTFHFTATTREVSPQLRHTKAPAENDLRGRHMLAVDDNPTNRMILSSQGEIWGMHVRATGSAREALEWIRNGDPFDIAILDMQMPHMDGVALAREIKRCREGLPMILLTSLGKPEARPKDMTLFSAYHTKPIRAAQLHDTLCQTLIPSDQSLAVQHPPTRTAPRPAPAPLRILLAEDNNVNQQLALRMLNKIGYSADAVSDGAQVLDALRNRPYDVILMDVHMPVMNGMDASRAIQREWPGRQRPRIIALTASALPEDREACIAAGMDDYITKPLSIETLAAALAQPTTSAEDLRSAP
ncbi:response regulator [Streptomyces sp. NBC_01614]|uniref:response regulator n=1 Tax=Streptomyces sp. NBC_01614 TaxID=2975897 RepID=UPI003866CCB0